MLAIPCPARGKRLRASGHQLRPYPRLAQRLPTKSARTPVRGTPRGCRPACHTECASGENWLSQANVRSTIQSSAQARHMLRAAHGQPGHDMPRQQRIAPGRSRDPRAHGIRSVPQSPAFAGQRGNRTSRLGLLASRSGSRRSGPRRAARPSITNGCVYPHCLTFSAASN